MISAVRWRHIQVLQETSNYQIIFEILDLSVKQNQVIIDPINLQNQYISLQGQDGTSGMFHPINESSQCGHLDECTLGGIVSLDFQHILLNWSTFLSTSNKINMLYYTQQQKIETNKQVNYKKTNGFFGEVPINSPTFYALLDTLWRVYLTSPLICKLNANSCFDT